MMAARLRQSHAVDPAKHEREVRNSELFFRRNFLRHLPPDTTSPILDIGCGMGHFLEFCRVHGYTDVSGVDLGQANVDFCRSRGFHVELDEGGAYLQHTDQSFGAVVMNDVIEHTSKERVIPLMELVRSRLRPGGVFILKTLNAANPILGAHGRYNDFTHELSWTEESMQEALEQAGFSAVGIFPSNLYVFYMNPVNWIARGVAACFDLFFLLYFRLHGRSTTHIFTKNIIAVGHRARDEP
jgi:2-polyprenyl-3-methyl-5-hydroxy-6-metoxy-1,4-benzoquinol methylase